MLQVGAIGIKEKEDEEEEDDDDDYDDSFEGRF
jgi:hypothetical protein